MGQIINKSIDRILKVVRDESANPSHNGKVCDRVAQAGMHELLYFAGSSDAAKRSSSLPGSCYFGAHCFDKRNLGGSYYCTKSFYSPVKPKLQ